MDYARIYAEFIADRLAKQPAYLCGLRYSSVRTKLRRMFGDKGGLETHHIVPSWRGGTDAADNVVTLTFREHVFAHLLLAKAYGGKEYGALWATAGITRTGKRSVARVLRNRAVMERMRAELRAAQVGAKSAVANHEAMTWIEYSTGETFTGSRHDLVAHIGHGETAKWEIGDHLGGKTLLTRSGWFSTERFPSIAALDAYKQQIKDVARIASKAKNSGAGSVRARAVLCVETGIVYPTQRAAAEATGAIQAKISEVCAGTRRLAGGYRWAFADDLEGISRAQAIDTSKRFAQPRPALPSLRRAVICVETGERFDGIVSAASAKGVRKSGISNVLAGRIKQTGGFRWAYA